jgi:hypothetical protein
MSSDSRLQTAIYKQQDPRKILSNEERIFSGKFF